MNPSRRKVMTISLVAMGAAIAGLLLVQRITMITMPIPIRTSEWPTTRRDLAKSVAAESVRSEPRVTSLDQEPIVIVDYWYDTSDSPFIAAAILRNQSDEYVGDIKVQIRLYDDEILYFYKDDLIPDKKVLKPGEDTIVFVDNLRAHRIDGHDTMPSVVDMEVAQYRMVSEADYPYVEPPEFSYNKIRYRANWIDGMWIELKNPGPHIYKSSEGDPNGTGSIGAHYPYLLGVAFFNNGKMVHADRPFPRPRGHQVPGDSAYDRIDPPDKVDSYRLFFAAESLATDVYPTQMVVESLSWHKIIDGPCGIRSECPQIEMDVSVKNASDLESKVYISLFMRDASGAPLHEFRCLRPDVGSPTSLTPSSLITIPPFESYHCSWTIADFELRSPPPNPGTERHISPIDDVEYMSVHVNSMTTTSNTEFAALKRTTVSCYRSSERTQPDPIVRLARVFLPSVYQAAKHLCDTIIP